METNRKIEDIKKSPLKKKEDEKIDLSSILNLSINEEKEESSNEINYYLEFIKEYKEIRKKEVNKPKLLLHVCCGPCSTYPLIFLHDLFDITIFYSNSNIFPKVEYDKRLYNLKKYLSDLNYRYQSKIEIIEDSYNYEEFKKDLVKFKDDKEITGNRCKVCIYKRMDSLFKYAIDNGFKYVTTVMSISRNKDATYINKVGKSLENKYKGSEVEFIYSDFKKNNGQEIGIKIAKNNNLYRQDYCGCEYSLINKEKELKIKRLRKEYELGVSYIVSNDNNELLSRNLESLKNQDIKMEYALNIYLFNPSEENLKTVKYYESLNRDLFNVIDVNDIESEVLNNINKIKNYSIKTMNSKYLIFLDSTSILRHDYLRKMYQKISKDDLDFVTSSFKIFNSVSLKVVPEYYENKEHSFLRKLFPNRLNKNDHYTKKVITNLMKNDNLSNKIYKREILLNNSIIFPSSNELLNNAYFNFNYLLFTKKLGFINEFLLERESFFAFNNFNKLNESYINFETFTKTYINTLFLIKFYSIRVKRNKVSRVSYLAVKLKLYYYQIKYFKDNELSFKNFRALTDKEFKKLSKNTFSYEGSEWEKIIYLYIEEIKNDYFKK